MISIFFQGFVKRQKTFTQEWFFECGCPRCSDPTGPSMSFYLDCIQILSNYQILKRIASAATIPRNTVRFIYSEKATKFCEISIVDLSYVVTIKSTVEISQNFVASSEYMIFSNQDFKMQNF